MPEERTPEQQLRDFIRRSCFSALWKYGNPGQEWVRSGDFIISATALARASRAFEFIITHSDFDPSTGPGIALIIDAWPPGEIFVKRVGLPERKSKSYAEKAIQFDPSEDNVQGCEVIGQLLEWCLDHFPAIRQEWEEREAKARLTMRGPG